MTLRTVLVFAVAAAAGTAVALGHGEEDDGIPASPANYRVRGVPRAPRYHRHVEPILRRHCTTCHHDGDIAPMPLDSYADAALWIDEAIGEIDHGRMPPWRPTRGVGEYVGERGLSAREYGTLRAWLDTGLKEGRPPRRPRTPTYTTDWALGEPDAVLQYGESFPVPGTGDDVYRCFPVATDFPTDVFVTAVDVRPGERRVAHHVVLYMDPLGESFALDDAEEGPGYTCFGDAGIDNFGQIEGIELEDFLERGVGAVTSPVLGGWAPGNRPAPLPRGTGIRIPQGATVVIQVHYHPLPGEPVDDLTRVGLYLTDDPGTTDVFLAPIANLDFEIPAGATDHEVLAEISPADYIERLTGFSVGISGEALAVLPHMHLLGKQISVDALLPDGTEQRLVEIRDWSFDWQDAYRFRRPVPLPLGTSFRLRCVYDNSAGNPLNPNDPPIAVGWGDRTVDEMALAFVAVKLRLPPLLDPASAKLRPIRAAAPPAVRRVRFDRRGRMIVSARRLRGGGRIEIDGVAVDDSLRRARRTRALRSPGDWTDHVPLGVEVEVRVRRADGRLSHPFAVTR